MYILIFLWVLKPFHGDPGSNTVGTVVEGKYMGDIFIKTTEAEVPYQSSVADINIPSLLSGEKVIKVVNF